MTILRTVLAAALGLTALGALAADADPAVAERIRAAVAEVEPRIEIDAVGETPLPGIYEVVIGGQVAYLSGDGKYLVQGNIIELGSGRSVSDERRGELRLAKLEESVDESQMIIYEPGGEVSTQITVFTDIDCPYCRKMHADIEQMLAEGVRVRYLLMPRAGVGSGSYVKAVNAWCADDPRAALTAAKQGKRNEQRECDDPVTKHLRLARDLGITATPTIILEDGRVEAGYRDFATLKRALDL
ncbi:DsbC family protein [Alkalilimnicola sp. S0819]|uniref:DsbC family protein n=1 Tax=Alkalilimnicola sp. S0819 TaxID=2613922 RepID=UPI001261891F|nr:DsbC family protein [Alkalilimnicola sp. S0819]KAB7622584.1 DsbC family protein [Alkalilimnicola sp. S0819]MPQ17473.1 thioredoxin fold domain-containing protein [Alkalilimnicola sp. S0819]